MTCIVGLVDKGSLWIGGDSAGAAGWDIVERKDPKVFRRGNFLIGGTTSFRMLQLLRFRLSVADRPESMDAYEYMVTWFIDGARACLKEGGFATKLNEVETAGTFLVGYEGRLFKIEGDYQVGESAVDFDACGCGQSYALGAMTVLTDRAPAERVRAALETAARWSNGVRGPFVIEKL